MTADIPPYFGNPDGKKCQQCVYKSMLEHFNPSKEYTWDELDYICGAEPGKWSWTFKPLVELDKLGFEVIFHEIFDLEKFVADHEGYLNELYGAAQAKASIENSNMVKAISDAKEILEKSDRINWSQEPFSVEMVRNYLSNGYLLNIWVNPKKLEGEEGTGGHFVLAYDINDTHITIHDSGGVRDGEPYKQFAERKVEINHFMEATKMKPEDEPATLMAVRPKKV